MVLSMSRPWKHPDTGIYWLRKRVPDDLRTLVGKREEKQSLRTRDPHEAKIRHAEALAQVERRWQGLKAPPRQLSDAELVGATQHVAQWIDANGMPERIKWDAVAAERLWDPSVYDAFFRGPEGMKLSLAVGAMQSFCQEEAAHYARRHGLPGDEASTLKLAKAIGFGVQQGALSLGRRARGDFSASPVDSMATPTGHAGSKTPASPVLLRALLEGWAAEKQPVDKTIYSWSRVVTQLEGYLGHGDAVRISADDLIRWKEALLASGLRTKTIRDSKIAPLRAILQWGVDNRKLPENPAARVQIDVRGKMAERIRGFTDQEAALILRAAGEEADPVKRWVPLLCAYSGARLSEVCQLRKEDVVQEAGIWCVKFAPEAGSLKNAHSERLVPLHPATIDAGFLRYVAAIKVGPLFSGLRVPMDGIGAPFALVVDVVEPVSGQATVGALQPVRDWSKANPLRTISVDYRPSSPAIREGAAVEIGLRAQPRALEKPRTAMSGFERGLPYRKKLREQAAAESRGKPVAVAGNPFLTSTTAGRPASGGTAGDLASRQAPAQLPPAAYIPPNDVEAEMAVAGAIFGLRKPDLARVRDRAAPLLVHRAGCSAGEARARITATIESMARRGALCKDSANIVRLDGSKLLPGHKRAAVVEADRRQGPHEPADILDGGPT